MNAVAGGGQDIAVGQRGDVVVLHVGLVGIVELPENGPVPGEPLDDPAVQAREYLVQTLEPDAHDSFFAWNFFDEILSRNEYFSPYIFEDTALSLLESDAALRRAFETRKKEDPAFAGNSYAQLRFIYERSPWSEPTYRRYPVYRLDP